MRYTRQERLDIGKDIYENHLSYGEASKKYGISTTTAGNYYLQYLDEAGLESNKRSSYKGRKRYEDMSKAKIIDKLIRASVEAENAKK